MRAFLPQPRLFGLLHARKFATAVNTAPKLRSLTPSASERAAGRFGPANLLLALEALHQDGIVEITDVVNENHLDALNERMIPDAYTLRDMRESPYNYNRGNIQQDPPPEPSLFFRDIFLNPFALQVSNAVLGNRPKMTFCSGNTALKSTDRQPVHTDADFAQPSPLLADPDFVAGDTVHNIVECAGGLGHPDRGTMECAGGLGHPDRGTRSGWPEPRHGQAWGSRGLPWSSPSRGTRLGREGPEHRRGVRWPPQAASACQLKPCTVRHFHRVQDLLAVGDARPGKGHIFAEYIYSRN
ncbi:phytanoyl-CoA dioxygenase [Rhizoctonia solani]|uniref:Phytanoyl-CoA dioxygenase n=1 Tax=Rhizoctonia solani TaxID=456999 RepID=A0A8H8P2P6_9AGAM|nr:phytanoyl-CoA dioxygenase [Rhizoctonia solani]QRW23310.1 phytanoyl-CoA dioxygenase [Rhizoctonia solani]